MWATPAHVVGVSKTFEGRLELFLVGGHLSVTTATVRSALEHGLWWHADSTTPAFAATRLLLPAATHFDEVAAFICTELLRNDADNDVVLAFTNVEPLIALLFERLRLSENAFLGLAGELLVLDALSAHNPQQTPSLMESWNGWKRSLRDFAFNGIGVEVKTTTRTSSSHQIQGTHQIEADDGETSGEAEVGLFLVSVGLRLAGMHSNTFTVPALVSRIVSRLHKASRGDLVDVFLAHVREYGAEFGFGYNHVTMSEDSAFQLTFEPLFVRSYNMLDSNISVLRRSDVVARDHVDPSSLMYVVDLPAHVSGSLNPVAGLNASASVILSAAGLA